MPPSISTEARALSQASSWPVSTMPPDLIVTVESDAVPGSSSTSATRIEPEVSLPPPAIVSMPVPLAPTTISCDPVVHSEPASSMLATPSAPSCLPSNAAPVVALAPFASARAPTPRSPSTTAAEPARHSVSWPDNRKVPKPPERTPSQPPSLSTRAPAETSSIPLPDSPSASAPAPMRHSVFWPESSTWPKAPSSIPTRAPLLLRIAPSLTSSFPDLFWLMPACNGAEP